MKNVHYDWNAKLVRFFADNTRLVWLLMLAIIVGGTFSLLSLRREGFPTISPKFIFIQTVYPGASASEVEKKVTAELESAIKDIKNLKEFSSISQNSFSNIAITLSDDADLDKSVQDAQRLVQSAQASLPKEVEVPKVNSFDTFGPSYTLGITGDGSINDLRKQASVVANELSSVSGVKSAKLAIDRAERVNVAFRTSDMTRNNVALTTLNGVIASANVNFPVGNLTIDNKKSAVTSVGSFSSLDDIRNLVVASNAISRAPILVKDVATVSINLSEESAIERFGYVKDGKLVSRSGVLVNVQILKTADVISTKSLIDEQLNKAKTSGTINQKTEIIALQDQADSTKAQVTEINEGAFGAKKNLYLLGGLQLLFLSMLLFVNWRAALLAALSLPLSLGVTFMSLLFLGVQLNTIVLFSLILVLGLVVDPAVVMVEAIQRYRDLNLSARDATLESGRRYGAALFMAVLTSFIVFVPFGVVSGIFGQIIKYIPLTVIPALVASYLVPIAILPMLAKYILPKSKQDVQADSEHTDLSRAANFVMKLNAWVLANRLRQIGALLISFMLVGAAVSLVATGKINIVQFATPEDNQNLSITVTLNKGLGYGDKDNATKSLEHVLNSTAQIKHYYYQTQDDGQMIVWVELKPKSERAGTGDKSKAVLKKIREDTQNINGFSEVSVIEAGVGPPESDYQIQTQLYSDKFDTLASAAKDIGAYLSKLDHVVKVDDGFSEQAVPEMRLLLNRDLVQKFGLSSAEIGQQLRGVLDETKVTKYENSDGEAMDVVVINAEKPANIENIKQLPLVNRAGLIIKVGDVANVALANVPNAVQRFNGLRFVNVKARLDDQKNTIAVQQKLDQYMTSAKIKELGLESRQNRGEFEEIARSFRELGIALVIAILLTYLVLVLQFKSFSQPFIMLFTIPMAFIGVFPALYLTKSDLGFLELLGVTILVGIVENVAIFLIDYANQLRREEGLGAGEAIIRASGVRFRPILLTKLVALGGLLPLAIESDFWRGLSVVIIAGIGVSGFLSLVIIPVLYVWIDFLRTKVHHRLIRRST